MRKELGKPTRELFFARLGEIAPDFERVSTYDIKGFSWSFLRREGDLRQWLWFQRHKYDDAFTIELSWSCVHDDPTIPGFGSPTDPFVREGCRFRLCRFWEPARDVWWYVVEPALDALGLPLAGDILEPPAIDMPVALTSMRRAVGNAVERIQEHALPYFDRVAQWTRGEAGDAGATLWDVWRQDDNGNRILVSAGHSRAEAGRICAEFESHGHRQLYWAAPSRRRAG